jgi:uncharacterized protein YdcH (DUF465 family)
MGNEAVPRRAPHLAAMFQKAYAQAVMIQGLDEQIASLLEQRDRLENEIVEIQGSINGQFEQMVSVAKKARLRLRAQVENAEGRVTTQVGHMKLASPEMANGARAAS